MKGVAAMKFTNIIDPKVCPTTGFICGLANPESPYLNVKEDWCRRCLTVYYEGGKQPEDPFWSRPLSGDDRTHCWRFSDVDSLLED
jgi:hypothetical protein